MSSLGELLAGEWKGPSKRNQLLRRFEDGWSQVESPQSRKVDIKASSIGAKGLGNAQ
jgi:hypothetical protein